MQEVDWPFLRGVGNLLLIAATNGFGIGETSAGLEKRAEFKRSWTDDFLVVMQIYLSVTIYASYTHAVQFISH